MTSGTELPLLGQATVRLAGAPASKDVILNQVREPPPPAPAPEVLSRLTEALNDVKTQGTAQASGQLSYQNLVASPAYQRFQACAAALVGVDLTELRDPWDQLAFWINLYNALVIDAVIAFQVRRSVREIRGFFNKAAYLVGGLQFSASDVEHGVLRANRGHPAIPGSQFRRGDPRRKVSLTTLDARVHFALVCGARSCPPIAAYSPAEMDRQLDFAAASFVNGGAVTCDRVRRTATLSRIFLWYARDFGGPPFAIGNRQSILRYVAAFVSDPADRAYLASARPRVRFQRYDWSLNGGVGVGRIA